MISLHSTANRWQSFSHSARSIFGCGSSKNERIKGCGFLIVNVSANESGVVVSDGTIWSSDANSLLHTFNLSNQDLVFSTGSDIH